MSKEYRDSLKHSPELESSVPLNEEASAPILTKKPPQKKVLNQSSNINYIINLIDKIDSHHSNSEEIFKQLTNRLEEILIENSKKTADQNPTITAATRSSIVPLNNNPTHSAISPTNISQQTT